MLVAVVTVTVVVPDTPRVMAIPPVVYPNALATSFVNAAYVVEADERFDVDRNNATL
jgi:hypothetical protein